LANDILNNSDIIKEINHIKAIPYLPKKVFINRENKIKREK
jgi:hypothetical protein